MKASQKLKINQEAQFHKLTTQDSVKLMQIYGELKIAIDIIIKKDSLPEGIWFPSKDFEYLIKQL